MKTLRINRIWERHPSTADWRPGILAEPRHPLAEAPWERQFPYRPEVAFAVGESGDGFYLCYHVREAHVRAVATGVNGRVWEDSCVEFFVGLGEGEAHFAFEFSCIGVILAAYHDSAGERHWLPAASTEAIEVSPSLPCGVPIDRREELEWSLLSYIPFGVFLDHAEAVRSRGVLPANFYKCGDRLDRPHYLCWNPVRSARPRFHAPECFGELIRV